MDTLPIEGGQCGNSRAACLRMVTALDQAKLDAFEVVLGELSALALSVGRPYLKRISLVPAANIEDHANALLVEHGLQGVYASPAGGNTGIAIPIEDRNGLSCYVLLDEEYVLNIDPAHPRSPKLVSTLLEELLHVEVYAEILDHQGYVLPTGQHVPLYLRDITMVAAKFRDEYLVNRRKAHILRNNALIEFDGVLQVAVVYTPGSLEEYFNLSARKLHQIVYNAATGQANVEATWDAILSWLLRDVFDDLGYAAGRSAGGPSPQQAIQGASLSSFFRDHVHRYWVQILRELEGIHDSNLVNITSGTEKIVEQFRLFLSHIGVELEPPARYWFSDRFWQWLDEDC